MDNQGKLINEIEDREGYKSTYPKLTIKDSMKQTGGALHEIHIFLLPLNPDFNVLQEALKIADEYNRNKVGDL